MEPDLSHINLDALKKGSRVRAEDIERATRTRRTERRYGLAVLRVKAALEEAMLERHQMKVTLREDSNDLLIMTDEEADIYLAGQFLRDLRQLGTHHRRRATVDLSQLRPEQRQEHHRSMGIQAELLRGVRPMRRRLAPDPVAYNRPTNV